MKLRCLVTDDEPIARQIIEGYIDQVPYLELAGSCKSALEALEQLKQQRIDILFLDINMPHLNGLSMLRTIRRRPHVIITTAYPEYAVEGFELAVTDYLLKPFSLERFLQAVERVVTQKQSASDTAFAKSDTGPTRDHLFLKTTDKIIRLRLRDILYAEAYGNYTKLYTAGERHILPQPLGQFREYLPEDNFVRIHKSYLIALRHIDSIEGNRVIVHGKKLPIGKVYKRGLMEKVEVR